MVENLEPSCSIREGGMEHNDISIDNPTNNRPLAVTHFAVETIPEGIWRDIFSYLTAFNDLKNLMLTCRHFRGIANRQISLVMLLIKMRMDNGWSLGEQLQKRPLKNIFPALNEPEKLAGDISFEVIKNNNAAEIISLTVDSKRYETPHQYFIYCLQYCINNVEIFSLYIDHVHINIKYILISSFLFSLQQNILNKENFLAILTRKFAKPLSSLHEGLLVNYNAHALNFLFEIQLISVVDFFAEILEKSEITYFKDQIFNVEIFFNRIKKSPHVNKLTLLCRNLSVGVLLQLVGDNDKYAIFLIARNFLNIKVFNTMISQPENLEGFARTDLKNHPIYIVLKKSEEDDIQKNLSNLLSGIDIPTLYNIIKEYRYPSLGVTNYLVGNDLFKCLMCYSGGYEFALWLEKRFSSDYKIADLFLEENFLERYYFRPMFNSVFEENIKRILKGTDIAKSFYSKISSGALSLDDLLKNLSIIKIINFLSMIFYLYEVDNILSLVEKKRLPPGFLTSFFQNNQNIQLDLIYFLNISEFSPVDKILKNLNVQYKSNRLSSAACGMFYFYFLLGSKIFNGLIRLVSRSEEPDIYIKLIEENIEGYGNLFHACVKVEENKSDQDEYLKELFSTLTILSPIDSGLIKRMLKAEVAVPSQKTRRGENIFEIGLSCKKYAVLKVLLEKMTVYLSPDEIIEMIKVSEQNQLFLKADFKKINIVLKFIETLKVPDALRKDKINLIRKCRDVLESLQNLSPKENTFHLSFDTSGPFSKRRKLPENINEQKLEDEENEDSEECTQSEEEYEIPKRGT